MDRLTHYTLSSEDPTNEHVALGLAELDISILVTVSRIRGEVDAFSKSSGVFSCIRSIEASPPNILETVLVRAVKETFFV